MTNFDVCIYSNAILNIKKAYENAYSILKKGGKLLTICFGTKTTGYKCGKCIEKNTFVDIDRGPFQQRGVTHFFTNDELEKILIDIGYKVISKDEIFYSDQGNEVQQFVFIAENSEKNTWLYKIL